MKSSSRHGFTLIELMLYLAIAGALAVGIIAASGPSLARQRYNSGVQTFQDFLEGIYSSVNNVQNVSGHGRSGTIIYGKFITFGEKSAGIIDPYENTFHIYDVIGDVYDPNNSTADSTIAALMEVHACLYRATITTPTGETEEVNYCSQPASAAIEDSAVHFVNHDTFTSRLAIENSLGNKRHVASSGAILIVRSPTSGVISTYVTSGFDFSPDNYWDSASTPSSPAAVLADPTMDKKHYLTSFLDSSNNFQLRRDSFDFCLFSEDMRHATGTRRDIRIVSGASNSSGIIILPAEDVIDLEEGDGSGIKTRPDYPERSICQN